MLGEMIERTWLPTNVTSFPFCLALGSTVLCVAAFGESSPPISAQAYQVPRMARGGQTAILELKEISTHLWVNSGHGEVVPAKEKSGPGCGARSPGFCPGPATKSPCVIYQFPPLSESMSSLRPFCKQEPLLSFLL